MSAPKLRSSEAPPEDYTPDPAWGAGTALAAWHPAYKAGWGGVTHGDFLAGQIAVASIDGHMVALAAMYHPTLQPDRDDPGRTRAPSAIETIFSAAAAAISAH
jgi:hypothetical protein